MLLKSPVHDFLDWLNHYFLISFVFSYREVKHENIITYYGCALQQSGRARKNVHWIMIMEYCDDTLKSKFINSEYDNPAKVGNVYSVQVGQMEELARYAMQMCRGLEYLHSKKLVHRDMKLENILVKIYLAELL
jgi:serine/threonine protein kinase